MASPLNNFNFPHFAPPPPPPHVFPPPHPQPPPQPITPPPPSSPDNDTTVIIVVFVSFGCLFGVACCLFALWCFIKKRRSKRMVQKTEIVNIDEHLKMKEAIVQGPHGPETIFLSVEDDVHVDEEIKKNEITLGDKNMHAKSEHITLDALEAGQSSTSTSGTNHHLEHKE